MTRAAVDDGEAVSRNDKTKPARPRTERRLSRALTVTDLRAAARRRTPRAVFDYTDGAAEAEASLPPRSTDVGGGLG